MLDFNDSYPTQSEIERAKSRAVGGRRDRCIKGKSCSAACITSGYACLVELPSSPQDALRKIRDLIEKEPKPDHNQLTLFDVSKTLSKEGIEKNRDKFRDEMGEKVKEALSSWSRYNDKASEKAKEKYDNIRQEAIEYNKKMVKDGLADKAELLKVPVPWERALKALNSYEQAADKVWERAEEAALIGDKNKYLKEVKKYNAIHERLGSKLGRDKDGPEDIWDDMNGNGARKNPFLRGIRESPLFKNSTIELDGKIFDDLTEVKISKKVAGQKVSVYLENNGTEFSFKINDSYNKPNGLSVRDGLKIAKATEEMFSEIIGHMEDGSVIRVYPYNGDGRGHKRRAAYERFGFGLDRNRNEGSMYGEISDGVLSPATYSEFIRYKGNEEFNFAEGKTDRIRAMYVALWGEEPSEPRNKS